MVDPLPLINIIFENTHSIITILLSLSVISDNVVRVIYSKVTLFRITFVPMFVVMAEHSKFASFIITISHHIVPDIITTSAITSEGTESNIPLNEHRVSRSCPAHVMNGVVHSDTNNIIGNNKYKIIIIIIIIIITNKKKKKKKKKPSIEGSMKKISEMILGLVVIVLHVIRPFMETITITSETFTLLTITCFVPNVMSEFNVVCVCIAMSYIPLL
jgi:hypothetical protein